MTAPYYLDLQSGVTASIRGPAGSFTYLLGTTLPLEEVARLMNKADAAAAKEVLERLQKADELLRLCQAALSRAVWEPGLTEDTARKVDDYLTLLEMGGAVAAEGGRV